MRKKCYHMTKYLREIISDKKPQLKSIVGENSKYVNDVSENNMGISYSLGLEGIVATNAMFHARYQYEPLENQIDRDITLDDMFTQNIQEQEDKALGENIYLTFDETKEIEEENKERDIADPKTKQPIDLENIRGVILENVKTGDIRYDRESIIRYAISKVNKDFFEQLNGSDKPFMNMEGYGKTDFSFKEYVKRYYEEMLKDPKMNEIVNGEYELKEINVKQMLKIIEKNKIKQKITKQDILSIAKKKNVIIEKENSLEIIKQLEQTKEIEKSDKNYILE